MATPVEMISRLEISGYKSIRDQSLDLGRFNTLIGGNGSGKSNFLDFFRLIKSMFSATYGQAQLYMSRSGPPASILHYGPRMTKDLTASIQVVSGGDSLQYSFGMAWGTPDDLHFEREHLLHSITSTEFLSNRETSGGPGWESAVLGLADSENDSETRRLARSIRSMFSSIELYHFHDTSELSDIRRSQPFYRRERLEGLAGNLGVFLYRLKQDKPAHYRRILSTIQIVAPFILDFVLEPVDSSSDSVMIRWIDRSGELFGPQRLSDGTLRSIALVSALLQPEEMMPSVMLFDEPELGLHPSAVSLIAGMLKELSQVRQVIVATQSPALIRDYCPEDIIVAERREYSDGRGETEFKRLTSEPLSLWLEDYDLGELYEKNVTGGYPR